MGVQTTSTRGRQFSFNTPVLNDNTSLLWVLTGGARRTYDVNADGMGDLVWRNNASGDVAVWLMNGPTRGTTGIVMPGVPADWRIIGGGDFDGDLRADLLWRNQLTGDVAAWLMNGTSVKPGASASWRRVSDSPGSSRAPPIPRR